MAWPTEVSEFRPQEGLKATIAGLGAVDGRLASTLDGHGVERPMVVCGSHVRQSASFTRVVEALATEPVVFSGVRPHTPAEAVREGAALARAEAVDALIAVGGSSAVDCGKGIARLVVSGVDDVGSLTPLDFGAFDMSGRVRPDALPFISVTTTLSFAEFMPFWGARHAGLGRKIPYADDGCVVRTVFLDGLIAEATPDSVWAETGVKALDDAISSFCRFGEADPFRDPIDLSAIAALCEWLPRSLGSGHAAERQQVLTAVWMTKFGLPRLARPVVRSWFSTAARHALGGTYELAHGIGSCVALPIALRVHADVTHARQRELAEALRWPAGDPPLEPGLRELLKKLGVPASLTEVGIDASGLDGLDGLDGIEGIEGLEGLVDHVMIEAPGLGTRDDVRRLCEQLW